MRLRRTEVVIEIHQIVSIRAGGSRLPQWCTLCAARSNMITPEEAAALRQVGPETITRWLDTMLMHSETSDGQIFICLASLFQVSDDEEIGLG